MPEHVVDEDGKMRVSRKREFCQYCWRGECRRIDGIGRRPLFRSSLCPSSVMKQQTILREVVIYKKRVWNEYLAIQRMCVLI